MKTYSLNPIFNRLCLTFLTGMILAACDTPQTPVGRPSIKPSASASASPVVSDEPLCMQTLQCVVDSTINNSLRKETQEVINQLFKTAEPKYTQLCKSKADELAKPSSSTLPKASPSTK